MKKPALALAALTAAGPACAQGIALVPLADVRVRYEHVDQQGLAHDADALTIRMRGGVQATSGPWSALAEVQGTLAPVGAYDDGLSGPSSRPLVADPQNIALYRAQVNYHGKALDLTLGRQRIALDDERFVGNAGFRDNAQTFDAIRAQLAMIPKLKLDIAYAWSVRTIWGINGAGARQQAVGGDNLFANLAWATPVGSLMGFAYLVDQDEAAVQGFRLSSQTYGARLAGGRALSAKARLSWQLSYARQGDWHRNPNHYTADYYLADAALTVAGWSVNAGYEVLGADRGAAFTSFQTPLATGFRFQGWADKFLTTPPDGVRDLYAGGGYRRAQWLGADLVTLSGAWHRFRSDRLVRGYGSEIDFLATVKVRRTTVSARYAHYRADGFATDTDKAWLQFDWTY